MSRQAIAFRVVQTLACLLVVKTTLAIVLGYRDYFPPNFYSDFLHGRDGYFFGLYRWAFYVHIVTGPFTLLAGMVLLSSSLRRRFPQWHRCLGRVQGVCVIFLLAPSGLWMAWYAESGWVAGLSFATLSVATVFCAAVRRRVGKQRLGGSSNCINAGCNAALCCSVRPLCSECSAGSRSRSEQTGPIRTPLG